MAACWRSRPGELIVRGRAARIILISGKMILISAKMGANTLVIS
jgi:hypothetical protein